MSRVASKPVLVPPGVRVSISEQVLLVETAKEKRSFRVQQGIKVELAGDIVTFLYDKSDSRVCAWAGTARALFHNMMRGLTKGFEKRLELVGVGYKVQMQGRALNLSLGYSHPVILTLPDGISAESPSQTEIVIKGVDKDKVGQFASEIRRLRPPEPYKGKGVRYAKEQVLLKETKKKK